MVDNTDPALALGDIAARQLANATKTVPQLSTITPRWLVHLLEWQPVEAGIFRLNKVKNPSLVEVACAWSATSPNCHRLTWIMKNNPASFT